ncbi:TetR/AcrR family transcriptional regulator [Microbacterium karelineae]|uniref:TetR/AcrR family transcriptional regulator n=1 Tax=Microbacterium karelineae TaxID=2654283 RepID=UPI0012EA4529|nr:TetR family transcriptional regulator C-terminal domain-containing protein [Microbacterium karelineae]
MSSAPSRRRAPRRSPEERRAEIASAAREIALADGIAAITMRSVAARVDVAPALVAHYVPTMDELTSSTFREITSGELAEITQLAAGLAPRAALAEIVRTTVGGGRDDVTAIWVEAWALGRRNETLAAAVRAQMDAWAALLRGVIERGAADGSFRVDDADAAAWQLLGMIDGLNAQGLVRWGDTSDRATLLLRAAEGMLGAR